MLAGESGSQALPSSTQAASTRTPPGRRMDLTVFWVKNSIMPDSLSCGGHHRWSQWQDWFAGTHCLWVSRFRNDEPFVSAYSLVYRKSAPNNGAILIIRMCNACTDR